MSSVPGTGQPPSGQSAEQSARAGLSQYGPPSMRLSRQIFCLPHPWEHTKSFPFVLLQHALLEGQLRRSQLPLIHSGQGLSSSIIRQSKSTSQPQPHVLGLNSLSTGQSGLSTSQRSPGSLLQSVFGPSLHFLGQFRSSPEPPTRPSQSFSPHCTGSSYSHSTPNVMLPPSTSHCLTMFSAVQPFRAQPEEEDLAQQNGSSSQQYSLESTEPEPKEHCPCEYGMADKAKISAAAAIDTFICSLGG
mmetsp:Transcript_13050/g.24502  ORF Transcript_13050/g.24502 Transcript_13050/m.24502 type:complete len:245 (-) Transcript_13050:35-769(-)